MKQQTQTLDMMKMLRHKNLRAGLTLNKIFGEEL